MKNSRALLLTLAVCTVFILPACGTSTSNVTTPTPTVVPAFSGTWTGTATDSTGTPFGTGIAGTGMTTWTLTRTGNQVSGTIAVNGVVPAPGQPTIAVGGTVSANVWTYTITVPAGGVIGLPGCSETINGTLTLAATGDLMTGSYTGNNTCGGTIVNGQLTLQRQ